MKTHELPAGSSHVLVGPAQFRVKAGFVEVVATRIGAQETLEVPLGKRIPLHAGTDTTIELACDDGAFAPSEQSALPAEWDALADTIARTHAAGTLTRIVVLGEVDTGKTFFSTYLGNRLLGKGCRTAILDCDTGQSDIGPPGTFGMLVLERPTVFFADLPPTHLFLLGAHSPGLHFLPAMVGLHKMLEQAERAVDFLIVDTTGWVQGDGGRAIKRAKLDLIDPQYIVLLQRGNELEHLVRHVPAGRLVRLPVSKKTIPTHQMERKVLRERASTRYFASARTIELPFAQVATDRVFLLTGFPLRLEGTLHAERLSGWEGTLVVTPGPMLPENRTTWPQDLGMIRQVVAGQEVGLMVALLDQRGNTLAIGRLERIDYAHQRFLVRTPWAGDTATITCVQFGSLRLNEKGEEDGFIEPGTL